jgi:hypothetical protein
MLHGASLIQDLSTLLHLLHLRYQAGGRRVSSNDQTCPKLGRRVLEPSCEPSPWHRSSDLLSAKISLECEERRPTLLIGDLDNFSGSELGKHVLGILVLEKHQFSLLRI